jgi:hypothetical protein
VFACVCVNRLADAVWFDGQFSSATVDEDRETDRARTSVMHQCIESRPNRPSGMHDFVDEDDALAIHVERNLALVFDDAMPISIVSKGTDVERTARDRGALDLSHCEREPLGDVKAAAQDSDDDEILRSLIALENFVSHPAEGSAHVSGIESQFAHLPWIMTPNSRRNSSRTELL